MKYKRFRRIAKGLVLILTLYAILNFAPNKHFMLIVFGFILVSTLVFNTFFCGWICPMGTLFDLIRGIGKKFGNLSFIQPTNKVFKKWVKKNKTVLLKIDHYLRYFRYVFFLWILQSIFLGLASIKEEGERGIMSVLYLLIAMLVSGLFIERSWCKYICPVGAFLGIVSKISISRISRNQDLCIKCNICSKVCPMNIDVANRISVNDIDCQSGLKCVDACPVENALSFKTEIPLFSLKKQSKQNK
ncbi:MAG: 4Fe-4S binding protein [Paludibacteraceae bacterium]|nr:4Fe-4S binding protein [Paludibacteraceae bacterium]